MLGGKQECRKPDLAFLDPSLASSAEIPWSRIRAFGELRDDFAEIGKNQALHTIVVSMMHRARLIFQSQPGRRCIQTFTPGGDYLRCFVIDRAGVVASQAFSIHRKEKMALRVFWAFFHGAPAWYDLDPSIMGILDRKESIFDPTSVAFGTVVPYIYIPDSASGSNICVFLDRQPFEARQAVISKGSTLWRAKDENGRRLIVKDQWRNAERGAEGEFLKTLTGARGISKYIHHGDIMLPSGEIDRTNVIRADLAVDNGVSVLPLYDAAYGYHETTPALSRRSRSRLSAEQRWMARGKTQLPISLNMLNLSQLRASEDSALAVSNNRPNAYTLLRPQLLGPYSKCLARMNASTAGLSWSPTVGHSLPFVRQASFSAPSAVHSSVLASILMSIRFADL